MSAVTHTTAPRGTGIALPRIPRVPRSPDRIVSGTAAAYAARWRVEPTVVRAALGVLTLVGGLGLALYGIGVATTVPPTREPLPAPADGAVDHTREIAIGAGTAAILLLARSVGLWPGDGVMIPAIVVALAVALVWTGGRAKNVSDITPAVRIGAGVVLAISGVAALAARTGGLANVGRSIAAIAVVIGGLAVVAAPALGRFLSRLDDERTARVREEERADLAAHLHDSVLQSLVLIQRADDPRQMSGLARRQERELRSWLYGGRSLGEPTGVDAAVEAMATSIEADHQTRIEAVVVGDAELDDAARAFIGVLREATTNAARHAGVEHIDVYVEVDDDALVGYVRDTGCGFDPTIVADDRHGLRESIIGRAERVGGKAIVTTAPGAGTEVEVHVPRGSR